MNVLAMDRPDSSDDFERATGGTLAYIAYMISQLRTVLSRDGAFKGRELDSILSSVQDVLYESGALEYDPLAEKLYQHGFTSDFSQKLARALTNR